MSVPFSVSGAKSRQICLFPCNICLNACAQSVGLRKLEGIRIDIRAIGLKMHIPLDQVARTLALLVPMRFGAGHPTVRQQNYG